MPHMNEYFGKLHSSFQVCSHSVVGLNSFIVMQTGNHALVIVSWLFNKLEVLANRSQFHILLFDLLASDLGHVA